MSGDIYQASTRW